MKLLCPQLSITWQRLTRCTKKRLPEPWNSLGITQANNMLKKQKAFEGKSDRREPLHGKVLAHVMALSETSHELSFRWAIWLWTNLSWYNRCRIQEYAMEKKHEIQVNVKPNGMQVVWVFTMKDFIWYDVDDIIAELDSVLQNRLLAN